MENMKICGSCKRKLPRDTDHFYRNKGKKDGLTYNCRECRGSHFTSKLKWREGYRVCTKCEQEILETIEHFRIREDRGFISICRECENEDNMERRQQNPDWHKQYYEKNKESILEANRLWREQNKQRVSEWQKEYYQENKDKILKYGKKYREINKAKIKVQRSDWRKANAEKVRVAKQRRRAKKVQLPATLTKTEWYKIKLHFNNSCAYCGATEREHFGKVGERLHQEHFISVGNGGEYTHNNIIPSCRACNSSKGEKLFSEWYPNYEHYSEERAERILRFLGYNKKQEQQLTLIL